MLLQAALIIATGLSTGACKAELLELGRPELIYFAHSD